MDYCAMILEGMLPAACAEKYFYCSPVSFIGCHNALQLAIEGNWEGG